MMMEGGISRQEEHQQMKYIMMEICLDKWKKGYILSIVLSKSEYVRGLVAE